MTEKAALLARAEFFQKEGKIDTAIGWYGKYLHLEPDDLETRKQWIDCLCLEAVARNDDSYFNQANQALIEILRKDWAWQRGHQHRIDLFYHFGKLGILQKEYEQLRLGDKAVQKKCDEVIKIIGLMEKFKQDPVVVRTDLSNEEGLTGWLKNFWPMITGVPVILWIAYGVCVSPSSKDKSNLVAVFFILMVLCLAVIGLFYFSMRLRQKNSNKNEKQIG